MSIPEQDMVNRNLVAPRLVNHQLLPHLSMKNPDQSQIPESHGSTKILHTRTKLQPSPQDPCTVYLPTVTIHERQM